MTSLLRRLPKALVLPFCLIAPAAPAAELYCPQTETRISVLGDSLSDGVWASLFRSWRGCATVKLDRVTKVSDGLTVTSPEDWAARLAASLDGAKADVVIVQFGANDIRPVRTADGRAMFGTEDWATAYGERVTTLLTALEPQAARAIWLGLPIVGDEKLEGSYVGVTAAQLAAVTDWSGAMPATFVDIHEATKFGTGAFVQSAEVDGSMVQLRAGDLIHFTDKGYDMVAATFTADLEAGLRARDAEKALNELALQ